jgi:ribonuclease HIII
MPTLMQTVEGTIERLQTAVTRQDKNEINRAIAALEASFIDNNGYRAVGDERLLAISYHLLSCCYGDELKPQLQGLSQQLDLMHSIHDRLFAILDPAVELDELLFDSLSRWPIADKPIACQFDQQDKDELHRARSTGTTEQRLENFLAVYFRQLRAKGCGDIVDLIQHSVDLALEGYKHMHSWTVQGLFATSESGEVYGLKIRAEGNGQGTIKALGTIGPQMQKAADRALVCVQGLRAQTKMWNFTWEIGRDDITFEGNSIGLALTIGILAKVDAFDIDAYTAFTGHVRWETGQVSSIDQINLKLEGARGLGIRRVFYPQENKKEVSNVEGLRLFPVESVADAYQLLQSQSYINAHSDPERLAQAKIRELEVELATRGITKVACSDESHHKRVTFSNYSEEILVLVYHGQKGLRVVPQGKPGSTLLKIVQEVSDRVFGARPATGVAPVKPSDRLRETYKVRDPNTQQRIEKYIFARSDVLRESEKNCAYRAKIVRGNQTVFVRQYDSSTLMVDGDAPLYNEIDKGIRAILGLTELPNDESGKQNRNREQIRAVESVELGEMWVGTDEAGKGDYFGPLVSAAVLVDKSLAKTLEELGVRDSKSLSDKRNRELAAEIAKLCGKRAQVVTIPPIRYNQLYEEFHREGKNLNTLLAWAHTRGLENILIAFPHERFSVLVDKFADEEQILNKLLPEGRRANLNIVQMPKAEVNVAVAAASILARAQFLRALEDLSRLCGFELPKGASDPRIPDIAKQIISRRGQSDLAKFAKLHFKTTQKILGQTDPSS